MKTAIKLLLVLTGIFHFNLSVIACTNPDAATAVDGSRCGPGTVQISVTNVPIGSTIDWYSSPEEGTVLPGGTGIINFTTPIINKNTIYYAETRDIETGCVSSTRTAVTANVFSVVFDLGTFDLGTGTQDDPFKVTNASHLKLFPSGIYYFNLDGSTFKGSVDNSTEGGGWIQILNYVHQGGTNPELNVRNTDLPIPTDAVLGADESGTDAWGHASNSLVNALNPTQLMFYGETSLHDRIINFSTSYSNVLSYAKTGSGSFSGIEQAENYKLLSGHNATIPQMASDFFENQGDLALTNFPFWIYDETHWGIKGNDYRWEVDDYAQNEDNSTIHRIWCRNTTLTPIADGNTRCGTGTLDIAVIDVPSGITVDWYSLSEEGTVLTGGSGTLNYTTPQISETTTYYAEFRDNSAGCVSSTRLPVIATVNPLPSVSLSNFPDICVGTTAISLPYSAPVNSPDQYAIDWSNEANAAGMADISWTDLEQGAIEITDIVITTGKYAALIHVKNSTTGCQSIVSNGRAVVCETIGEWGSKTLTAPNSGIFASIDFASYGTPTGTCENFTLGACHSETSLAVVENAAIGNTSFSIEAKNDIFGDPCGGTQKWLEIQAVSYAQVLKVVSAPEVNSSTGATACVTAKLTLSATPSTGATIDWYADLTGGTPLQSGSLTFTTPSISSTTNYFIEARDTVSGCVSISRSVETATITGDEVPPGLGSGTFSDPFYVTNAAYLTRFPSGTYYFNIDGISFRGSVDNSTEGGGWIQILNYVHQGGTNPELHVRANDLPIPTNAVLGDDESETDAWGHASNDFLNTLNPDALMFYGQSSAHDRIINFITNSPEVIEYAKTGIGNFEQFENSTSYTLLPAHTGNIPQNFNGFFGNQGDYALTQFPFYESASKHWAVRGFESRWEVDDFPDDYSNSTIHKIWGRNTSAITRNIVLPAFSAINSKCPVVIDAPTLEDNCMGTVVGVTNTEFPITAPGLTTVVWVFDDGNGNITTKNQEVVISPDDTTIVPVVACNSYTWIDGITYTESNNSATFTLENEAGCDSLLRLNLTITIAPAPTASNNGPVCEGSEIILSATDIEDATYSWTGPDGFESEEQNPVVTVAGVYSVTSTVNGCTSEASETTVIVNILLNAPTASNNGPVCEGSEIILSATDIEDATYSWTGPDGFESEEQNPVVTVAGVYSVTATVNGCTSEASETTVVIAGQLLVDLSAIDATCYGSDNGSITATVNAGSGNLSYVWNTSPEQYTATASGLTAGTYAVTVTDNVAGCSATVTATIAQPDALEVDHEVTDASCSSCADGAATISVTGGTAPYTYSWINQQGGNTATALAPGEYTVTVTDDNGCAATVVIEVGYNISVNEQAGMKSVNIYPNPANAVIHYSANIDGKELMVQLVDVQGRIITTSIHTTFNGVVTSSVNTSVLNPGVYQLRFISERGVSNKKFVVTH
jgi:hypothetical protein